MLVVSIYLLFAAVSICSERYVPSKRKHKAEFLQLLPLVPPAGLPAAPSTQRTWKLLVLAHDGSVRPQAVAVTGAKGLLAFYDAFVCTETAAAY
jgi:hypothetical protein